MRQLRIALVGNYPIDPNKIVGGPQAVFTYLLQGLKRFPDLELHVVTAQKVLDDSYSIQRDNVILHYLPYPRQPVFLAYPSLQKRVHRVLHQIKPDLVHGQSAHIFGSIALSASYPTVLTPHNIHGSETIYARNWLDRQNIGLQYSLSRRYFIANVRHILSISPYIRHYYEPLVKATFYDIDNPISDSFFELDMNFGLPDQILFVGLLRARKRPDLALEAFSLASRKMPKLNLRFAGAITNPAIRTKLDEIITGNDLDGNVEFLEHLSETQLLEAYQEMSILLLTSELETSPMVVEQAMAAGKPVVATAVGGVPYLIEDGRTGILVDPNEPEQIAQALVTLVQNPDLREQMGKASREVALSRFKTEVVSRKVHEMYRAILDQS